MEAAWRFGVDRKQIMLLSEFSVEKIRELACCTKAVITLIPMNTPSNVSMATHATLLRQTINSTLVS